MKWAPNEVEEEEGGGFGDDFDDFEEGEEDAEFDDFNDDFQEAGPPARAQLTPVFACVRSRPLLIIYGELTNLPSPSSIFPLSPPPPTLSLPLGLT